jgi:hypothetical protein
LAGLSFDSGVNSDPSTPAAGDTWFNSSSNHLKFYDGAATKSLAFTDDNITGNAGNVTGTVAVANGGTGATTASGARTNLGAAASGANSDITSLSGLTTPLSIGQGGTGANSAATARTNLGAGTVNSVGTGTGLAGGPITTSGTISLLAATAGTLGGVKAPTCAAGSHFSGIAVDGTLSCSADATTSSLSFSAITSGTSSGQSLVVGNGSTLAPTGTGTITATSAATATLAGNVTGLVAIANGGTGITTPPGAAGQYLRSSAANTWAVNTGVQASDLTGAPVRVTASTTSAASPTAGTTATAVASCAAGRVLLGGGAQVTNTQSPDMAVMSQSFPSSTSPGQWTALGVVIKNMNAANTMTVTAYALCSGT